MDRATGFEPVGWRFNSSRALFLDLVAGSPVVHKINNNNEIDGIPRTIISYIIVRGRILPGALIIWAQKKLPAISDGEFK